MVDNLKNLVVDKLTHISAETVGWVAVIFIHASTIPTLLAVMQGLTDRLPQVDMLLMVWFGLAMFFVKSVIQKDILNILTIGIGFIIQAAMLALIFIK